MVIEKPSTFSPMGSFGFAELILSCLCERQKQGCPWVKLQGGKPVGGRPRGDWFPMGS